jgi:hypothetical protein
MLNFIERYHLDRDGIAPLPNQLKQINELLKSDYLDNPYKISEGVKRRTYLVVDYFNLDEFDQPTIYTLPDLSSACSTVYRLIRQEFPRLVKVDFAAKNKYLTKFPKKYEKFISELLEVLFEIDPLFNINNDIKLYKEIKPGYFYDNSPVDCGVFAYLIHDGGSVYDEISYATARRDDSKLLKYLSDRFELEPITSWATGLILKEPITSSQEKWNASHKAKVNGYVAKSNRNRPVYSFRPDSKLRQKLEELRQDGESNQQLLSRLLKY